MIDSIHSQVFEQLKAKVDSNNNCKKQAQEYKLLNISPSH